MKTDVAVLGGGLAGLSAGYHLRGRFVILEKESEPGGLCRSVHRDGFTFDHAPHILYPGDGYTRKLVRTLLAGNLEERTRMAVIYHRRYGVHTRFPFQTHLYGLPQAVVERCLRLMRSARQRTCLHPPRTYYQWILRNFGRGMAEEFMVPYSEKLWTVHPREMNCDWLRGRVVQPSLREIERGASGDTVKAFGFNTAFWYPRTGGIGALPAALAAGMKRNIRCRTAVTHIDPAAGTITLDRGGTVQCRRMIATLPLPVLVPMIAGVPGRVRNAAAALKFNSVTCVNLGVRNPEPSPYHWIYYHDPEYLMNRISLPANMSRGTAPAGAAGICAEIAHRPDEAVRPRQRTAAVIRNLCDAGVLRPGDGIAVKNTLSLPYAYVIYDARHRKNVNLVHGYLRSVGIEPAGRFGDWEYYNMDRTILSGKRAAEAVAGKRI